MTKALTITCVAFVLIYAAVSVNGAIFRMELLQSLDTCDQGRWASTCEDSVSFDLNYRTYDGKCTNLLHREWGSNNRPYFRLLSAQYDKELARGEFVFNVKQPKQLDLVDPKSNGRHTAMLGHFAQFISHDMSHAFQETFNCTNAESSSCRAHNRRSNTDFLTIMKDHELPRTLNCKRNGTREQLNIASAFIDASTVYGSYYFLGEKVLRDKDGLLKENLKFRSPKNLPYLPISDEILPLGYNQCANRKRGDVTIPCFVAGDFRANQHLMLTSLHTVFLREHNRIARKLKAMNQKWDSYKMFHETRKIIGAIMQRITFDDFLPAILGPTGMQMIGEYRGYNNETNAGVANEVSTAAFRFGHKFIPSVLHRLEENYEPFVLGDISLQDALFAPDKLLLDGGIDPLIRGAISTPLQGEFVDGDVMKKLSSNFRNLPLDLITVDIARSKDHGLAPYNAYREYCKLGRIQSFEEFATIAADGTNSTLLTKMYNGDIEAMDLLIGGLTEKSIVGGLVGPTFACLIADQFRRLREGDRFWYERDQIFRGRQRQAIKSYSFAKILCNSIDEPNLMPENPFLLSLDGLQGFIKCADLKDLDISAWKAK